MLVVVGQVQTLAHDESTALPADIQERYAVQLVDPSNLLIDRDNALAIAAAAEPYVSRVGQAQVFATILTDPTTLRGDQPVRDRHIWLVRYSGFAMTVAGPPDYETGRTSSDFLRVAYVLIDGDTGEWISTRLESG